MELSEQNIEEITQDNIRLKEENRRLSADLRAARREVKQREQTFGAIESNFNIRMNQFSKLAAESEKQKRYLTYLMKNSVDFFILLDETLNVAYASEVFLQKIGAQFLSAIEGKNILDVYKSFTNDNFVRETGEYLSQMTASREAVHCDAAMDVERSGVTRNYRISNAPMFNAVGELCGVIIAWYDNSDIINAKNDAIAANESKSRFLATMSHEIRTPMNAIVGISEIFLSKNDLSEEQRTGLVNINNSAISLLGIINDILDLSKIESGKLELAPAAYDVPSLINDAVQLNIIRIDSKPIEFSLDIDENLPVKLFGDELRLKQILNNILSNAFKYTDEGKVNLTVAHKRQDDDITLVFIVSDTGQGMKPEDLDRLFSEYSRFNAEANRATEGTGLGMSITRKLVALMNGTIDVESEYGRGSTFTVNVRQGGIGDAIIGAELAEKLKNFTFSRNNQGGAAQIIRETMPYGSVLIVDDVDTNLYVAKGLLSPYGLAIETSDSGYAALEKVQGGAVYDIIFMDHMMPEMDGVETTRKLRELGYTAPIVALTANAITGNDKMFMENGFDSFISKPIDIRQLNAVLNKFVRDRHKREAAAIAAMPIQDRLAKPGSDLMPLEIFRGDAAKTSKFMRHYFVINPKSFVRLEDLKHFLLSVENCFSVGNRAEYKIYISRYPRDAVAAVHRYAASVRDDETVRIYAVGGDGILFDCLNGMAEFENAELASVPYGNANDFINAFGAENFDAFRDIKRLSEAPSVPVDLIRCGSRFALINCSIGAESQAVMHMNGIMKAMNKGKNTRRFIPALYKIGAVNGIINGSILPKRYTVEIDGADKSGEYMNMNIANTAFNGGGNIPNPYAVPNDGELDIVFLNRLSRFHTISIMPGYTRGQFEKYPQILTHLRFREMSCRSETPMPVILDGESFMTSEITFKALPGAVKIAVPNGLGFVDATARVGRKTKEALHESQS